MYEWTREGCEDYLARGETITVGGPFIRNVVLMVHYPKGWFLQMFFITSIGILLII